MDTNKTIFTLQTHLEIVAASDSGQDRGEIVFLSDRVIIVIADGAGGTSGGETAAETIISAIQTVANNQSPSRDDLFWARLLAQLDRDMIGMPECGESTAVVLEIANNHIMGASVGDSGAWIIQGEHHIDLTCRQYRKPLLGSGEASPMPVRHPLQTGTLLLASDGLFKYAPADQIRELAKMENLQTAADRLINATRLRSGTLQDDIVIALCRIAAAEA